jgi:hypothetical protein
MSKQRKKSPGGVRGKAELDQHSAIRNPTSEGFWKSRGYPARPPDWRTTTPRHQRPPGKKSR